MVSAARFLIFFIMVGNRHWGTKIGNSKESTTLTDMQPLGTGMWPHNQQPVREAISYRGLFTAGWFGVREKHCFRLKIYDRLRASEQAP